MGYRLPVFEYVWTEPLGPVISFIYPGHGDIKMDKACSAPEKTGRKNYKILSPRRACADGLNII
jgi:hypothetical protein